MHRREAVGERGARRPTAATAKLCHPDKNSDSRAPSAFDAARDAYDILSDPGQRQEMRPGGEARLSEEKKNPKKKVR